MFGALDAHIALQNIFQHVEGCQIFCGVFIQLSFHFYVPSQSFSYVKSGVEKNYLEF